MAQTTLKALLQFARLASEARSAAAILPILAETACQLLQLPAAAVLQVTAQGQLALAAGHGLPAELSSFHCEPDEIDSALGPRMLAAAPGRFTHAQTVLMVSGGDLYGVLVLLTQATEPLGDDARQLAETLADLAAVVVNKAEQLAELERSNDELRASREALARSEKLRALGQMAAGIAHDLKNILNPLGLQVQLLRRRLARDPARAPEVLADMEEALRTGLAVVDRLRTFGRQEPERQVEAIDIDAVVQRVANLVRTQLEERPGIKLVTTLGQPPQAVIHGPELETAVVNLVVNAIDAVGERGTIRVSTSSQGGGACIEIADDGPGMSPEVEQRVFEPFFTTKGQKGTGLGLAMVYALVQRAAGRVDLRTAPGQGARFTIWLPGRATR
ncbi:MAG: HAMP domain-containing histidine kinase [Deltaproteobacteria bacterium]|nr:HAMP domain-containing histidine kinase [Deltaproteobacteria bacterium]